MGKSEFRGLDSFWWDMPILAKPSILKQEKWRLFRRRGDLSLRRAKWWGIEWNKVWITEECRLVLCRERRQHSLTIIDLPPHDSEKRICWNQGLLPFQSIGFNEWMTLPQKPTKKCIFTDKSRAYREKFLVAPKMHRCWTCPNSRIQRLDSGLDSGVTPYFVRLSQIITA